MGFVSARRCIILRLRLTLVKLDPLEYRKRVFAEFFAPNHVEINPPLQKFTSWAGPVIIGSSVVKPHSLTNRANLNRQWTTGALNVSPESSDFFPTCWVVMIERCSKCWVVLIETLLA